MIKRKSSLYKLIYEKAGQKSFFGRDNLSLKAVNMAKKQRFDNICIKFKIRKFTNNTSLSLKVINI